MFIWQQVHVENAATAAWTEHGSLLKEAIVLHNVKYAVFKLLR
jgi:hypothetical protein